MSSEVKPRRALAIELAVCTLLIGLLSLNAMRRMDYLGADTAQHIRMTDESRSAYVAKNIADGNGYTTNDLPAALVDFYDQRGKLHDAHWVNADRFPFAAYATALVYKLTGSTSWKVGILGYNIVAFVAFFVLLYGLTRGVWRDRYAALAALGLAMVHAYTYQFLYWKDGDMLLLSTATIWALYRYFARPDEMSWKLALGLGTLLAFVFLARPNLGAPLILAFGFVTLRRIWRIRRDGARAVARQLGPREGLALAVGFVWCVPFIIHTLSEWGTPLFSANNLYQLPLGTRFGMGTDTWWKYTEPGHIPTLGALAHAAGGELASKFTSSWASTLKSLLASYPVELALAIGAFRWSRRSSDRERVEATRPLRQVTAVFGFAFATNLALLPLYGYQDYNYRHYLGFALPLLWLYAGRALVLVVAGVRPAIPAIRDHVRRHRAIYGLLVIVGLIGWNLGAASWDTSRLFTRTSQLIEKHWLIPACAVVAAVAWRWLVRPPWFPRLAIGAALLAWLFYKPNLEVKRADFAWFPASDKVWTALRGHDGIVSSFALQGEVAWNTGRRNIPAPEWPMHVYSLWFDHQVEIEDLYIESADALLAGPFGPAAAGFEGYARLQHYRTLPGYQVAYHDATRRAYPKFRIHPQPKASTVFHLVDREAFRAIAHSPDRIDLGDPNNVIYTPHGWTDYYELDGKHALAGTDVTRSRYPSGAPAPYEDASVTFFLDQRRPTSFDLELYAPVATSYELYWNLDLYAWDRPGDRAAHLIGTYTASAPGWQRAHFDVPAGVTRAGLNKLGFRAAMMQSTVMCPAGLSDDTCRAAVPAHRPDEEGGYSTGPIVLRPTGQPGVEVMWLTLLAGTLELHY
ncbi:MAG TPA: hypothetical protein VLX92_23070 [Kofleriaceae bacterium]|nr:hypothetical protein [Kofleriaceae bacterium]